MALEPLGFKEPLVTPQTGSALLAVSTTGDRWGVCVCVCVCVCVLGGRIHTCVHICMTFESSGDCVRGVDEITVS